MADNSGEHARPPVDDANKPAFIQLAELNDNSIEKQARDEAAGFRLPAGWETDRTLITGVTIDSKHTPDRDDIIGMPVYREDDSSLITIGISDVGFIADMPATIHRALRRGKTQYERSRIISSMLNSAISESALSILEQQTTPVVARTYVFEDSALTAPTGDPFLAAARPTKLPFEEVDHVMGYDQDSPLHMLLKMAKNLDEIQIIDPHRKNFGYALNDDGRFERVPKNFDVAPSMHVVQAFMILHNIEAANWMYENGHPALYRNNSYGTDNMSLAEIRGVLQNGTFEDQNEMLGMLRAHRGRSELSTTPAGHNVIGADRYLRLTSPLRRPEDMVNAMNYWAAITGQQYPFPAETMPYILDRLHDLDIRQDKAKHAIMEKRNKKKASTDKRTAPRKGRMAVHAIVGGNRVTSQIPDELVESIHNDLLQGKLSLMDIGQLILATPPYAQSDRQDPSWAAVTEELFAFIHEHIGQAPSILNDIKQASGGTVSVAKNSDSQLDGPKFSASFERLDTEPVTADVFNAPNNKTAERRAAVMIMEVLAGRRESGDTYVYERTMQPKNYAADLTKLFQALASHAPPRFEDTEVSKNGYTEIRSVVYSPDGTFLAEGSGGNKDEAHQDAARKAFESRSLEPLE